MRIGSNLVFSPQTFGDAKVELSLTVSALDRLAPAAVDTLFSVLRSPRLTDTARVRTLISQRVLNVSQSLQEAAGSYARSAAAQALSGAHALAEAMDGLTQVGHTMQQLPKEEEVRTIRKSMTKPNAMLPKRSVDLFKKCKRIRRSCLYLQVISRRPLKGAPRHSKVLTNTTVMI